MFFNDEDGAMATDADAAVQAPAADETPVETPAADETPATEEPVA